MSQMARRLCEPPGCRRTIEIATCDFPNDESIWLPMRTPAPLLTQLLIRRRSILAALMLLATVSKTAWCQALEYEISFDDAANHYVKVEMTITKLPKGPTTLMMPVWTPGSYLIREYARNIDTISATAPDGTKLPLQKLTRNRWRLQTNKGIDSAIVTYRLYCHEMSVRTNWVDTDMAILNGAPTFLTIPERRHQPHVVTLKLPQGWKTGVSSLPESVKGQSWTAATFEQLVDNPIIAGNPVTKKFEAGGKAHQLISFGGTSLWELDKAAADVKKIVAEHQKMFATVPYDNYKFLNMITEARGGLEHDNCCLIMTSRWNFRDEEKYEDWLSLVSHEFFHTWNVRRLRPAGIWEYELEQENYTSSLWIAEGITSYYEDVLLARAGLIDRDAYLKRFSKLVKTLQTANGRKVQSLTDASHDAWIKFYRPDANSKNSRTSYYTKGAVVGFLLDAKIREATDGKKSLDDVMRTMYKNFASRKGYQGKGYTEQDFRKVASQVAGEDLANWFTSTVDSTDELEYQQALNYFGLEFAPDDKSAKDKEQNKDRDKESHQEKKPKIDVGITFSTSASNPTISAIRSNSAAFKAGLNIDDEVIAINDFRTSKSKWEDQLKSFAANTAEQTTKSKSTIVRITISRRGALKTLPLELSKAPNESWKLKVIAKPSGDQTARIRAWLSIADSSENALAP